MERKGEGILESLFELFDRFPVLATFLASVSVAFLSLEAGFRYGIRGEAKRVQISAMVEPHTLELIDQERGERSRGQYLDWLVRRRRRRQSVS